MRLAILGLPRINSFDDLARQMHLSRGLLFKCVKYPDKQYRVFDIPKKTSGVRTISQPSAELKAMQAWILRNILDRLHVSSASKGFLRDTSTRDNAEPHVGASAVMSLDLDDFFPTIRASQVFSVFHTIGYTPGVASTLTSLCTVAGRLPQGAPTSPKLSNLICYRLDVRILGYVGKRGIVYTRYADDLTFSALSYVKLMRAFPFVRRIINSEGFQLNHAKTRIAGPARRHRITGLIVTDSGVGIGRDKYREVRAEIHALCQLGKADVPPANLARIQGLLAYVKSVDPPRFEKLLVYIYKLRTKYPSTAVESLPNLG